MCERYNGNIGALDVPGELLFRVTTWHVTLFVLNARMVKILVVPAAPRMNFTSIAGS